MNRLLRFLVFSMTSFGSIVVAAAQTPATNFDGTYVGGVTNVQDLMGSRSACGEGGFLRSITIRAGSFSLVFNAAHFETIQGTVGSDGTVSGYTNSSGGGVRLSGRILGASITGDISSAGCKYSFQLQKR
jgi:hypothetical protein